MNNENQSRIVRNIISGNKIGYHMKKRKKRFIIIEKWKKKNYKKQAQTQIFKISI